MSSRIITIKVAGKNKKIRIWDDALVIPCTAEIALYELLGQGPLEYCKSKREQMLRDHSDKWFVKLTLKFEKLMFPELTQGTDKLKSAKSIGRLLVSLRAGCNGDEKRWHQFCKGNFFKQIKAKVLDAVEELNGDFLKDLGGAMNATTPTLNIYRCLLKNRQAVEQCTRKVELLRLINSHGLTYEPGSFYRLCREIGLPVSQG